MAESQDTAALSFWGVLVPEEAWRPLAAVGMNIAVLVALVWLQWPLQATFGK